MKSYNESEREREREMKKGKEYHGKKNMKMKGFLRILNKRERERK